MDPPAASKKTDRSRVRSRAAVVVAGGSGGDNADVPDEGQQRSRTQRRVLWNARWKDDAMRSIVEEDEAVAERQDPVLLATAAVAAAAEAAAAVAPLIRTKTKAKAKSTAAITTTPTPTTITTTQDKEYWAAVRVVHEEIQKLPAMEKAAYLQACECVSPAILRREASALQFLQFEKLDFAAAAKRLCRYWTKRQELFANRWRLPVLCLDGITGALNERDIAVLQTGVVVKLAAGATGKAVLCFDPTSRATHIHSRDVSQLRCWFFWFQEIICSRSGSSHNNNGSSSSSSSSSSSDGHTLSAENGLCVLRCVDNLESNKKVWKQIGDLAMQAFPIGKMDSITCHVRRQQPSDTDTLSTSESLGTTTTPTYASRPGTANSTTLANEPLVTTLICDSAEEMREKLLSLQNHNGVHYFEYPESFPLTLGGCWQYSKFDAWLHHRVRCGFDSTAAATTTSSSTTSSSTTIPAATTYAPMTGRLRRQRQTSLSERIGMRNRIRMKMDAIFFNAVLVSKTKA